MSGTDNSTGRREVDRLYDLNKSDVEFLTGISGTTALVGVAAGADVPVVAVAASVAGYTINAIITYDAVMDYLEITNPSGSDKAKLGLNIINYGLTLTPIVGPGWALPAAGISIFDLSGGFDPIYEEFNK